MKQYWNESVTQESWEILQGFAARHKFVLIGGWAAYLHTKTQKSKDIDIAVDFGTLRELDAQYSLAKNERLGKYEIKKGEVDIDIYVPKFSRLSYPVLELLKKHAQIDGIAVAGVHQLLLLKLGAYADRLGTVKGEKDAIDIVGLLYNCKFEREEFEEEQKKTRMKNCMETLKGIVREFPDEKLQYIGAGFADFKKWRREFLKL